MLEAAAKLSIADKDDASENSKVPQDPASAAETDVLVTSAESEEHFGASEAPAPDASQEVPVEMTDGVLQSSASMRAAVRTAVGSTRCSTCV